MGVMYETETVPRRSRQSLSGRLAQGILWKCRFAEAPLLPCLGPLQLSFSNWLVQETLCTLIIIKDHKELLLTWVFITIESTILELKTKNFLYFKSNKPIIYIIFF